MKYERLTEREDNAIGMSCEISDIVDRLCELEDKIEDGTLVELPCKVGDTVYCVCNGCDDVFEEEIKRITYTTENGITSYIIIEDYNGGEIWYWGIEAFTTKAEAEARLKDLRGEV